MVRAIALKGQTGGASLPGGGLPKDTLLLSDLGLTNVRQEPRVGSAAMHKMIPRLAQAQLPIDRQPDFPGVLVFLPVVFPPAYRAKGQRAGRLQRSVSAAWAAKTSLHSVPSRMDGFPGPRVYEKDHLRPSFCNGKSHRPTPALVLNLKTRAPGKFLPQRFRCLEY